MANTEVNIAIRAQDEASRELKKVEGSLGGLGSAAGTAAKVFAGFGIAAAGAVTAFATKSVLDFSRVGDEVEKMSKRTGLGAEAVSALRVAAEAGGTSIESIEAAVKKMQLTTQDLAKSSPDLVYQLEAIGFSLKDIVAMSPDKQFETLGNAIAMVEDPAQRTQMAIAAFGKAGTDLIPMFEDGNFAMEDWKKKAQELGVAFDDVSAGNAARLNDALGAMNTAFSGLALKIGGELAPVITKLIEDYLLPLAEKIIEMAPTLQEMKDGFGGILDRFNSLMASFDASTGLISQLRDGFNQVWEQVANELKPALEELWVAMEPLRPLMEDLAKVAIGGLVIILKVLLELLLNAIKAFIEIVTIIAKVSSAMLTILKPAIDATRAAIHSLIDPIKQAIQMFDNMRAAAAAAFNAAKGAVGNVVNAVLPGRASGGPVTGGSPYIVGERGPELFVPSQNGTIVPNGALGGGGGMSISLFAGATVNVTNEADEQRLARTVISELTRALQGSRNGLATTV